MYDNLNPEGPAHDPRNKQQQQHNHDQQQQQLHKTTTALPTTATATATAVYDVQGPVKPVRRHGARQSPG